MEDEITLTEAIFLPEEFKIDLKTREIQVQVTSSIDSSSSLVLTVSFPKDYPVVSAKPRLSRMRMALNEVSLLRSLERKAVEDAKESSLTFLNLVEICKDALLVSKPPCPICLDTVICDSWITLSAGCQHSFHSQTCLFRYVWESINAFLLSEEEVQTRSKQTQKRQELSNELKSVIDAQSALATKLGAAEQLVNELSKQIDELSVSDEGKKSKARHSKRYDGGLILDVTELQRQHTLALASLKTIEESISRETPLLESKMKKVQAALDSSSTTTTTTTTTTTNSGDLIHTVDSTGIETHLNACSKKPNVLTCPECRTMFPFSCLGNDYKSWLLENHATLLQRTDVSDNLPLNSSKASFELDDSTRKYLLRFKEKFSNDLNRLKAKGGIINDTS
jgi:hypothetical protein